MTTKRAKGFNSMDLALPVAPYYRTDPQILKDVETMRTNATSRWSKDDYSRALSRFHTTNDNPSKVAALAQPRVELLRANSPTLKRLIGARIKLERYANTTLRMNSASRQSVRETPHSKFHEKPSSVAPHPVQIPPPLPPPPPPPPPPAKQIKPQSNTGDRPLDKITYEKTWSLNGNMKQKCSLEIWLPKPSLDEDEERNSSRTATTIEKIVQPISLTKSRRSSIVKISATTITNIETKSIDDISSKKSESIVIPRVYHYGDYVMDLPDERPRSSKSVTTIKSDSAASMKSIRRQHARPNNRRLSTSTHHSEEILRFGTIEVPAPVKTPLVHTKSPNAKPTNPTVISELMQKYSLLKKNHQELTQSKVQLEKQNNDAKSNPSTAKDQTPRSRPPPISESTSLISPDHPIVGVKKLVVESSPVRSMTEQSIHTNSKLLERRATPRKPSQADIYPHLRIFSLANQRQHRQSAATIPPAILPNVSVRKTDEPPRVLQRSKTLDVVLNIPSPLKIKSRIPIPPDTLFQRNSKRSALNTRSGQHFQRSATTIPTNTLLIRFNHGTTERNYLVPD